MRKILITLVSCILMDQGYSLTPAPEDLARHIDSLVQTCFEKEVVPGAIISLVSPDSVYLVKGYGWSDIEDGRKAGGDHSLFQLGSIGKLLTVIAVLQQVERGKLDLHTDVNQYLDDWKIKNPYDTPLLYFIC